MSTMYRCTALVVTPANDSTILHGSQRQLQLFLKRWPCMRGSVTMGIFEDPPVWAAPL
jgi:hypothetical protein